MMQSVSPWHVFQLLKLVGDSLGMLGSLYVVYDLFGRRLKTLLRLVWVCSAWFLFTGVLLVSFVFLSLLSPGYLSQVIWRLVDVFSFIGLMILIICSSRTPASSPMIDWRRAIFPMVVMSIFLGGLGVAFAPHLIDVVIFALPAVLIIGILHGFAPVIQWRIMHLPERSVASLGALLIFFAFALAFVHPLLNSLGIVL